MACNILFAKAEPKLDGKHTVVGRVIEGVDKLSKALKGRMISPVAVGIHGHQRRRAALRGLEMEETAYFIHIHIPPS